MSGYRVKRYDKSNEGLSNPSWKVMLDRLRHSTMGCLVAANVVVFLVVKIVYLCGATVRLDYLYLEGPLGKTLTGPFVLLTYMFVHIDVLHLLFNMMWLWAFGIILTRIDGPRTMLSVYAASGIGGGLFFIATSTIMNESCALIGASAAVLGVIAAAAVRGGRERVRMMFFGSVQIRWVALIAIVLCVVSGGAGNTPVLAAHIGGAITGAAYALIKKYRNMPRKPVTRKAAPKVDTSGWHPQAVRQHERRGLSVAEQAEFDALLAKVRKTGYKNLSTADQRRLFELSSHIK